MLSLFSLVQVDSLYRLFTVSQFYEIIRLTYIRSCGDDTDELCLEKYIGVLIWLTCTLKADGSFSTCRTHDSDVRVVLK